ncbi:MAG: triose-phosphate isomerase [Bifidobacteriaceae bacterium]|jgi:triosephosphate isomerase|nr:triose-phosphate isomerase [Bifidobacteriaceae bacterium]
MTQRIPVVAGNWKMNFDHLEATYFIQKLAWLLRDAHFNYKAADIVIMPPFTSIRSVEVLVEAEKMKISVGAQTVSETAEGAFTGDISAQMLAKLGCSYVIIGHSERRKYHPEDDANLVDKVRAVLAAGMSPILCVGESFEERRQGIELGYAVQQVSDVMRDFSDEEARKVLIAYEPIWAIGTGMVATPQSAQDAAGAIREYFRTTYGESVSESVRILYGGSANASNASSLMEGPDVDGFLVGGASLDAEEFSRIARLTVKSAKDRAHRAA